LSAPYSSKPNDTLPSSRYRGRFAPSPTGPLHLGSLYTALASFLQARANRGEWLLRIDDVDSLRSIPCAADGILRTLDRHGLHWDGEVVFQSRSLEAYRAALNELESTGLLYPCTCSRQDLVARARRDPHRAGYPGFCRNLGRDRREPHALRIKVDGGMVVFTDQQQGEFRQDLTNEVGDFIVRRRDGIYAYHLATVIDDHQAGITEVMRGIDLLESTPRQIHLQRRLNLPTPAYRHVPVVVDAQGHKLSKQSGAVPVDDAHPSHTLFRLLNLLNQAPPNELRNAPPDEILRWAAGVWDVGKASGHSVTPLL
jgi:glutamyl-Q tRNA(Asp) synthetase